MRTESILVVFSMLGLLSLGWPSHTSLGQSRLAQQPFRAGVELVSLPLSVEDSSGQLVTGLGRDDFRIFEDDVEQQVALFSNEPQPIALAVVVDFSGSMRGERRDAALAAVARVGRALTDVDQWTLFAFADRTAVVKRWGQFTPSDVTLLGSIDSGAGTRLFSAILDVQKAMTAAPHRKRAMLLISDGNDISAQIGSGSTQSLKALSYIDGSEQKAANALRRGEMLLYAFGMDWPYQQRSIRARGPSERIDRKTLQGLAEPTGGRIWMARTRAELEEAARQLTTELRQQYTLGYSPTKPPDGKYRRIRVATNNKEYRVRFRRGYVATKR